jgi:hypothetical protein
MGTELGRGSSAWQRRREWWVGLVGDALGRI